MTGVLILVDDLKQARQAVYIQCNIWTCWLNHCCRTEEICITYSEFVFVALTIHLVNRMSNVILSSVTFPALHNLLMLSHKGPEFGKIY
jgi:hypothetical protein